MSDVAIRSIASLGIFVLALVLIWLVERIASRGIEGTYERLYMRKFVRYGGSVLTGVILIVVWQPFGGQFAAAFGLAAAGVAFAMQEVIGALAGWFNITVGRIFTIGDRIEMSGVRGDVIDITPLRTKLMEIGAPSDPSTWVKGRQHTGRMVAISNKATFTAPVYNFSAFFEFIWEEITVDIPHHEDHERASDILREEAERFSDTTEALESMQALRRQFPLPETELRPRVFASIDRDVIRLAARFVVPTRSARSVKDEMTRAVVRRLAEEGIEIVVTSVIQPGPDWIPVGSAHAAHTHPTNNEPP
jgi:small-conductance mechanosensitive channel